MFDESSSEAWQLRYGKASPALPDLAKFLNHRSVRRYKAESIPAETVEGLIAVAQSASTSSNLQLWTAISVQQGERRAQLAKLCADQKQVIDAPVFLAFFADHFRLRQAAAAVGESAEALDREEFFVMAVIDAALAAERLVCAAESIDLGVCYIGALRNDPYAIKEFFNLPAGVFGLFGLCIGWPAEPLRAAIKPRLPQHTVYFEETYQGHGIGDYDERMRAFYEAQGMKGDATWSMRSGRRSDEDHLTGRQAIRAFLHEQGLALR